MKKVTIIQRDLLNYRVPLYRDLAMYYDLTIVHTNNFSQKVNFKTVRVNFRSVLGMFIHCNLKSVPVLNRTVIVECNVRLVILWYVMLLGKMGLVEDIILWGNQQASNKLVNRLRKWLATRQVKSLFYSKNNAMSLCAFDYDNKKHFHYNNTVKVSHKNVENYSNKMRFINVGGCQKRKRQDIVIRAIAEVAKEYPRIEYIIIGNTENEKPLLDLSKELGVENNIRIIERIDNDLCISGYYDTCLASICFGQAGLTVQQSLGNGVPVIIGRQAINGGEKDAILHGKNGFLVADTNELVIAIKKLIANPTLARTMRRAAKNTYETAYKYEDMVKSFGQVIDASLS